MRLWAIASVVALGATQSIASAQVEIDFWLSGRQDTVRLDSAKVGAEKIDVTAERRFNRAQALIAKLHCADPLDCMTLTATLVSNGRSVTPPRPLRRTARDVTWEFESRSFTGTQPLELQIRSATALVAEVSLAE